MPISGYFNVPFGVSGDLTPVPNGVQPSGSVSYTQGWGPFYSQDPVTDPSTALLISRDQTNQLFFDVTSAIQALQGHAIPNFITTTMNGGTPFSYSKYDMVILTGIAYQSLENANTDTPPTAKWSAIPLGFQTAQLSGTFKNLKGLWASSTTATYTATGIVLSNSGGDSKVISAFNKTLNTATSGIGGLSTGSIANSTWYAVYAAYNPSTDTQGIFIDPSFTSPTLPSGYSFFARIGSVKTDGSAHLLGFKQIGAKTQFVVGSNLSALPTITSGTASYLTSVTVVGTFVPSTATVIDVILRCASGSTDGGDCGTAPNSSYSQPSFPAYVDANQSGSGGAADANIPASMILESSAIYYGSQSADNGLVCLGYEDAL